MSSVKIEMLEDFYGSPDGIHEIKYLKGRTYLVPEDLARVFISELRVAIKVKPKKVKVRAKGKRKSKK